MTKHPPPDWLASTQCEGKHRFADSGLAKKVAHRSAQRKDNPTSAYHCTTCNGWHVGTGKNSTKDKTRMNNKYQERRNG